MTVYEIVERKNEVNLDEMTVCAVDLDTLPHAIKTGLLQIGAVGKYFTAYNAFVFANHVYGEDERGYKFKYQKGRKWIVEEKTYKTVHDLYMKDVVRKQERSEPK